MLKNYPLPLVAVLAILASITLGAALAPSELFALDAAQVTAADSLEAELDAALQIQADPGETAFAVAASTNALDDDPLVRAEVAARFAAAGTGGDSWTVIQWQRPQPQYSNWLLILAK